MHSEHILFFYLVEDFTEDHVMRVRLLVQHLGKKGKWPTNRPWFFDNTDDTSCINQEDEPIRSVGGAIPLSSKQEGCGEYVNAENLKKLQEGIQELSRFSKALSVAFELQLDEQYVGRIENGAPDRLLTDGLLGEWTKALA